MIESVTNSSAPDTLPGASLTGGAVLGKDDFLQLLVAQLENQDPLNPDDPTEFTAQLAQFSSLEQMFNTNDLLAEIAKASQDNQDIERLSAVSLIGRQIEVAGPDFHFSENPVGFSYTLDTPAETISVQILDASSGDVVASPSQTAGEAGQHSFVWDGTGLSGQPVPAGDYRLLVQRSDGEETTAVPTSIASVVRAVDLSSPGSILTTDIGEFELAEVVSVTGL